MEDRHEIKKTIVATLTLSLELLADAREQLALATDDSLTAHETSATHLGASNLVATAEGQSVVILVVETDGNGAGESNNAGRFVVLSPAAEYSICSWLWVHLLRFFLGFLFCLHLGFVDFRRIYFHRVLLQCVHLDGVWPRTNRVGLITR